jgi:hypothetical protein
VMIMNKWMYESADMEDECTGYEASLNSLVSCRLRVIHPIFINKFPKSGVMTV